MKDLQEPTPSPPNRSRRTAYILAPLFLLLLILALINLISRLSATPAPEPSATAVPTAVTAVTQDATPTTVATPTPSPTPLPPTATPYVPPTFPPQAVIRLLGPPTESRFQAGQAVVFYWQWPLPLSADQQFAVYAGSEAPSRLVGVVTEPNLGNGYRLTVPTGDLGETAVPLQWQVQLVSEFSSDLLHSSEIRTLTLIP